jgi:hypothetical protein
MTAKLKSEDGKARYAKRRETVEPVFAQIKEHQDARKSALSGVCCARSARPAPTAWSW